MVSRPQDSEISFLRRPGAPPGGGVRPTGHPQGPSGGMEKARGRPQRPSVAVRELQLQKGALKVFATPKKQKKGRRFSTRNPQSTATYSKIAQPFIVAGPRAALLFHGPRGSLLSPPAYLTDEAAILEKAPSEATAPAPGDEPPSSNSSEAKARVCGRSEVQSAPPEGQVRMAGSVLGVVKNGRWRAAKLNKDENGTPAHQRRRTITFAVPLLSSATVSARFVPSSDLPGRQDTPPQHGQPPPAGRVVRTSRIHPGPPTRANFFDILSSRRAGRTHF